MRNAKGMRGSEPTLNRLLKLQLRLLPFALPILAVLVTVGITLGLISLLRATAGILIGTLMGLVLNRVQRLTWSEHQNLITFAFDAISFLMMLLFASLVLLRAFLALSLSDGLLESAVVGMSTALGVMSVRLRHLKRELSDITSAITKDP